MRFHPWREGGFLRPKHANFQSLLSIWDLHSINRLSMSALPRVVFISSYSFLLPSSTHFFVFTSLSVLLLQFFSSMSEYFVLELALVCWLSLSCSSPLWLLGQDNNVSLSFSLSCCAATDFLSPSLRQGHTQFSLSRSCFNSRNGYLSLPSFSSNRHAWVLPPLFIYCI